jgi:uncharacterized sodium:solute symporter family permease YidK
MAWWHRYTRAELILFGIGYALAAAGLLMSAMGDRVLGIGLTVLGGLIVVPAALTSHGDVTCLLGPVTTRSPRQRPGQGGPDAVVGARR